MRDTNPERNAGDTYPVTDRSASDTDTFNSTFTYPNTGYPNTHSNSHTYAGG